MERKYDYHDQNKFKEEFWALSGGLSETVHISVGGIWRSGSPEVTCGACLKAAARSQQAVARSATRCSVDSYGANSSCVTWQNKATLSSAALEGN